MVKKEKSIFFTRELDSVFGKKALNVKGLGQNIRFCLKIFISCILFMRFC
jgi:hypothetical protein